MTANNVPRGEYFKKIVAALTLLGITGKTASEADRILKENYGSEASKWKDFVRVQSDALKQQNGLDSHNGANTEVRRSMVGKINAASALLTGYAPSAIRAAIQDMKESTPASRLKNGFADAKIELTGYCKGLFARGLELVAKIRQSLTVRNG